MINNESIYYEDLIKLTDNFTKSHTHYKVIHAEWKAIYKGHTYALPKNEETYNELVQIVSQRLAQKFYPKNSLSSDTMDKILLQKDARSIANSLLIIHQWMKKCTSLNAIDNSKKFDSLMQMGQDISKDSIRIHGKEQSLPMPKDLEEYHALRRVINAEEKNPERSKEDIKKARELIDDVGFTLFRNYPFGEGEKGDQVYIETILKIIKQGNERNQAVATRLQKAYEEDTNNGTKESTYFPLDMVRGLSFLRRDGEIYDIERQPFNSSSNQVEEAKLIEEGKDKLKELVKNPEDDKWLFALQTAVTQNNGNTIMENIAPFSTQTIPYRQVVADYLPAELKIIRDENGLITQVDVVARLAIDLKRNGSIVQHNAISASLSYTITLGERGEPILSKTQVDFTSMKR